MLLLYYFDDIIKLKDSDIGILMDEKSHGNILIYDIYIEFQLVENLCILDFDKIAGGFIKIYDGTKYLTLFGC